MGIGSLNVASFKNLLSTFGLIAIAIVNAVIAIYITFYCFQSIGIKKLATRHNVKQSWLAWIPIANAYIYGKIAFNETWKAVALFVLKLAQLKLAPFLFSFLFLFDSKANFLIQILSIIYVALLFYATYRIYKRLSNKTIVMLLFSLLSLGTLIPIFLFAIKNNPIKNKN